MKTAHFSHDEFRCRCGCGKVIWTPALVYLLECARCYFNEPVYIISGTRCLGWNAKVGGVPHSQHVSGEAADICINKTTPGEIHRYLDALAGSFIGLAHDPKRGFIHVDVRGYPARWVYS